MAPVGRASPSPNPGALDFYRGDNGMDELDKLLELFRYERGVWLCRVCNKSAHVYEEFCPCQVNPETEAAIDAGTMSWDDVNRQGYVLTKVICRAGCGRRWKRKKPAPLPAEYYQ